MAELNQKCDDNKKITLHFASNILTVTITSNEIQYQRSSQRQNTNTKPLYSFIMRLQNRSMLLTKLARTLQHNANSNKRTENRM